MLRKTIMGLVLVLLSVTILSGCAAKPTEDPYLKITEIASTVQAELTQMAALTPSATPTLEPTPTATLEPPTNTPAVTNTPANTQAPTIPPNMTNDNSVFMGDVNYVDGTVLAAGTKFTKTWKFKNTGTTTWTTSYQIMYLQGTLKGTGDALSFYLTKEVKPGETAEISAEFTAPSANGRYTSMWKLYSSGGYLFGEYASIDIVVGDPNAITATPGGPTITPGGSTPTPTQQPTDPTTGS